MSDILDRANEYHTVLFSIGRLVNLALVLTSSYLMSSRGHMMATVILVLHEVNCSYDSRQSIFVVRSVNLLDNIYHHS